MASKSAIAGFVFVGLILFGILGYSIYALITPRTSYESRFMYIQDKPESKFTPWEYSITIVDVQKTILLNPSGVASTKAMLLSAANATIATVLGLSSTNDMYTKNGTSIIFYGNDEMNKGNIIFAFKGNWFLAWMIDPYSSTKIYLFWLNNPATILTIA